TASGGAARPSAARRTGSGGRWASSAGSWPPPSTTSAAGWRGSTPTRPRSCGGGPCRGPPCGRGGRPPPTGDLGRRAELPDELREALEESAVIPGAPMPVDLSEGGVVGIVGDRT